MIMELTEIQKKLDEATLAGVFDWRRQRSSLIVARNRKFKRNSAVYVAAPQYKGFGIVAFQGEGLEFPDRLSVLLENGNVWSYPVEDCRPANLSELPRSTRLACLRANGIKCEGRVFDCREKRTAK